MRNRRAYERGALFAVALLLAAPAAGLAGPDAETSVGPAQDGEPAWQPLP